MDKRDQYGNRVGQTDAYGNPVHGTTATDACGNPVHGTTTDHAYGNPMVSTHNQPQMMRPTTGTGHIGGTVLTRSGSSSSSSSEDDGMGGRRKKKGMKEKIKEKLPGGHKSTDDYGYGNATAGYGGGMTAGTGIHPEHHENKGMMEKIKEKLPGGHKTDEHGYGHGQTGTGYGGTTTGYGGMTTTTGAHPEHHENKGMMEKIKEKLPGGNKTDEHGYEHGHTATGYGGTATGYGGTTTTTAGAYPEHHEKKGMMEKIKEKLPGHH